MENTEYDVLTEQLLEQPCWVVDFLPEQVPFGSAGQYAAVEAYYRSPPQIDALYAAFAQVLLRLNCYVDFAVTDGRVWQENPAPQELRAHIAACVSDAEWRNILLPAEETLITFSGGDLYFTLYHPSEKLLALIRPLAAAAGLFVRKGNDA